MKTYWISFANEVNLGCCIVDAESDKEAYEKTNELGINPGGEVLILQLDPEDLITQVEIEQFGKNRLITREELMANDYKSTKELPSHVNDEISSIGSYVCQDCNESECQC